MADCVFCGIVEKTVPAEIVREDDQTVAFPDTKPQAAVHLLVVPKQHIRSVDQVRATEAGLVGKLMLAAAEVGRKQTDGSYRLWINAGDHVEVDHLHVHVTGDRRGGDRK